MILHVAWLFEHCLAASKLAFVKLFVSFWFGINSKNLLLPFVKIFACNLDWAVSRHFILRIIQIHRRGLARISPWDCLLSFQWILIFLVIFLLIYFENILVKYILITLLNFILLLFLIVGTYIWIWINIYRTLCTWVLEGHSIFKLIIRVLRKLTGARQNSRLKETSIVFKWKRLCIAWLRLDGTGIIR